MNLAAIFQLVSILPSLIVGAEHIFGKGNGDAKKASVIEQVKGSIALATTASGAVLPADKAAIASQVSEQVGNMIDSTVAILKATGAMPQTAH
ncbi:MAG: hypothetical protein JSS87_12850 [Acidobacteria bacterium]|nr:hypothetical protein [Acidobacteriota bacterium]